MYSTESGQWLRWEQTDDLDCEAWLKEGSLSPSTPGSDPAHLAGASYLASLTGRGFNSQPRDLTISVLLAKMAGNSWGDHTNGKTG